MQILRVNVSELSTRREELGQYEGWAGRGLIAKVLNAEVDPACSPLGPSNKLIIANGLLAGTGVSSTGRLSVGGKSPLTGGIKESNAGGVAGDALAHLGLRAIVVEGLPEEGALYLLKVGREGTELLRAEEYRGLGTYALAEKLYQRFGRKVALILIGPAGERRMALAGVAVSDKDGSPSRYAGRGGMGALMGAKGIKAVVLEEVRESVPVADRAALKTAQKAFTSALLEHHMTGRVFPELGTLQSLHTVRVLGALPVKNFSQGDVDGECPELLAENIRETILKRGGEGSPSHACMPGCVIRCSNVYPDADGKAIVSPLEYENTALLGPNLDIHDVDRIARLNHLCNDYGIDTMEGGVTIGIAMEAGVLPFGDFEGAARLLGEIAEGTLLGKVLGQGATTTGRVLGVQRVPAVKGQAISAYDPRAIKGLGVTYATSPMGADHGAGYVVYAKVDHKKPERQVEVSRNSQILRGAQDVVNVCSFVMIAAGERLHLLIDLVNAVNGTTYPLEWWRETGKEVLRMERRFNRAAGLGKADDRLPEFMMTEKLRPYDLVFDVPQDEIDHAFDELDD